MKNENDVICRNGAEELSDYIMLDSRRYDNNVRGD